MRLDLRAACLLLPFVAACWLSHELADHPLPSDAGPPPTPDAGPHSVPVTCGDRVCGSGEYCCASACGLCAPIGAVCADCHPDAGADAGPHRCGGFVGELCPAGQFCDYDDFTCGFGDAAGTCRDRPNLCTADDVPVCGCDHVTYPNACGANAVGLSIAHRGACDCRADSCPFGMHCEPCGTGFACLAPGAACGGTLE